MMILHIPITDETLQRILSYGDILLDDLTAQDLASIKAEAERSLINRIEDDPFHAYTTLVEGLILSCR